MIQLQYAVTHKETGDLMGIVETCHAWTAMTVVERRTGVPMWKLESKLYDERADIKSLLESLSPSDVLATLADILTGDATPAGTLEGLREIRAMKNH